MGVIAIDVVLGKLWCAGNAVSNYASKLVGC